MPLSVYVPSRVGEGYFTDWQAPASGATDTGKVWAWNDATGSYEPTALPMVSAFGATLIDDATAGDARTTLGLGTMATATETSYLLADGSRTGASSSLQTFTSGVVTGIVRPASDSTTALRVQKAAGTSDVLTVDTTNTITYFGNTSNQRHIRIGPFASDTRYQCIWVGSAGANIADAAFNAIDNGSTERNVFFNAPGSTGKLFFRQNNVTYFSVQSGRMQITTNQSSVGDADARLSILTDDEDKTAISVIGYAAQAADLQQWQNSAATVLAAIGPTGQIKTNQSSANTNTPSGATAHQLAIYDAAGTLLGFCPIYASAW